MKHLTLALIACSVFTGCMTQADKALWAEAKLTMSGKEETVTAEAPAEAAEPTKAVKTSKDSVDKEKEENSAPIKEEVRKPVRAN